MGSNKINILNNKYYHYVCYSQQIDSLYKWGGGAGAQSAAGAMPCHVPCERRTRWLNNHFGMLLEVFISAANKHFLLLKCQSTTFLGSGVVRQMLLLIDRVSRCGWAIHIAMGSLASGSTPSYVLQSETSVAGNATSLKRLNDIISSSLLIREPVAAHSM